MKINLVLDSQELTLRDLIWFEEHSPGTGGYRAVQDFAARFIRGENGERLDDETAREMALDLTLDQLVQITTKLMESVNKLQAQAITPPNGGGSS